MCTEFTLLLHVILIPWTVSKAALTYILMRLELLLSYEDLNLNDPKKRNRTDP